MRKSLEGIAHMVKSIPYPAPLPDSLLPLHVYVLDGGHCLLCVPGKFLADALKNGVDRYEVPLPVRYVLKRGYTPIPQTDAICVDVPYSDTLGALVPDGYEEF